MKKYNILLTESEKAIFTGILRRNIVFFSVCADEDPDLYTVEFLADTITCKRVLDLLKKSRVNLISEEV